MIVHDVIPDEDLVAHEYSDDCICGPRIEFQDGAKLVIHNSLDGREKDESEGLGRLIGRDE